MNDEPQGSEPIISPEAAAQATAIGRQARIAAEHAAEWAGATPASIDAARQAGGNLAERLLNTTIDEGHGLKADEAKTAANDWEAKLQDPKLGERRRSEAEAHGDWQAKRAAEFAELDQGKPLGTGMSDEALQASIDKVNSMKRA